MLNVIGAVLTAALGAALGFIRAAGYKRRVSSIASVLAGLELLRCEIGSRLTPLGELMQELSVRAPEQIRSLFASVSGDMKHLGTKAFADIWQDAVEECRSLDLSPQQRQELCSLGTVLGKYDAKLQSDAILRCSSRMEKFLSEAESDLHSKGRVCAAAGVAVGLMAAVIIL